MSDDIQERWIEVNDNDLSNPNLTYSGNWFVDSYDQPLEPSRRAIGGLSSGTAHGTNTTGGLAFTFIGRQVNIWGQSSAAPPPASVITCTINGAPGTQDNVTTSFRPGRLWKLCASDDLWTVGPGPHQVILNITSNSDVIYWVDYINYYSTLNPDLKGKTSRIVSASDSLRFLGYGWNNNVSAVPRTYIAADSVRTTFYGTTVEMRGYQDPRYPQTPGSASYSIDGASPVTFPLNPYRFDYRGLEADQPISRVSMFKTQPVALGNHTIEVFNLGTLNSVPLTFEVFLVTDEAPVSAPGTTPTTPATLPGGATTSSTPQEKQNLVPVIAGSVAGAVVLLFCGALVIFCLWRKKKRSKGLVSGGLETTGPRFRTTEPNTAFQPYYAVALEEPPPFSDCPSYSYDTPDDSLTVQVLSDSSSGTPAMRPTPPQTSRRRLPPPLPPNHYSVDPPPSPPESYSLPPFVSAPPSLLLHSPPAVENLALVSTSPPAWSRPIPPAPIARPRPAPRVRPATAGQLPIATLPPSVPEPEPFVRVSSTASPSLASSQSTKRRLPPPPPPLPRLNTSALRSPASGSSPAIPLIPPSPHRRAVPPPVARRVPPDPSRVLGRPGGP